MTLIRDLVELNRSAILHDAVHLELYANPEVNDDLAAGYIFGDTKPDGQKRSSADILRRLKESFLSRQQENVHVVIASYGMGKSHLGLTVANYFGRPATHPAVAGILAGLRHSIGSGPTKAFEDFKAEDGGRPHLVVRLTGGKFVDLRRGFLKALREALDEHPETVGYTLRERSVRALAYVKGLRSEQRTEAERHLRTMDGDWDLEGIERGLEDHRAEAIAAVEGLSALFNQGFPVDFGANVALDGILREVVTDLVGPNKAFRGVLVLFDEFGQFLRDWIRNPGDLAFQEITDACQALKGKLAFVTLIQRDPALFERDSSPGGVVDDVSRFTKRLSNKYTLVSSMEDVIDRVVRQREEAEWTEFLHRFKSVLHAETSRSRELLTRYAGPEWARKSTGEDRFHKVLTEGCYPFHPATVAVLCQLDLTQGRSLLHFVRDTLDTLWDFRAESIEGPLFIHPEAIIPYFRNELRAHENEDLRRRVAQFDQTVSELGRLDATDHIKVLRAMLLHYLAPIVKEGQPVKEIALFAGLKEERTGEVLKDLEARNLIGFDARGKQYVFFEVGASGKNLAEKLASELQRNPLSGSLCEALTSVIKPHADFKDHSFFESYTPQAERFKKQFNLAADSNGPWCLIRELKEPHQLVADAARSLTIEASDHRGVLWIFLPETEDAVAKLQVQVQKVLLDPSLAEKTRHLIVALPEAPVEGLQRLVNEWRRLKAWKAEDRKQYGAAYENAVNQRRDQIQDMLVKVERSLVYRWADGSGGLQSDRKVETAIESLFPLTYSKVAPVKCVDKLKTSGTTSKKYMPFFCRSLLSGGSIDVSKQKDDFASVYDALKNHPAGMGLVQASTNAILAEPFSEKVRDAWHRLDGLFVVNSSVPAIKAWVMLQAPPYGYDWNTFSLLFCHWIGQRRSELVFRGPKDTKKNAAIEVLSLQDVESLATGGKEFIEWLGKGVSVMRRERPPVADWVAQSLRIATRKEAEAFLSARERDVQENGGREALALNPDWQPLFERLQELEHQLKTHRTFDNRLAELDRASSNIRDLLQCRQQVLRLQLPIPFEGDVVADARVPVAERMLQKSKSLIDVACGHEIGPSPEEAVRHLQALEELKQAIESEPALAAEQEAIADALQRTRERQKAFEYARHDQAILAQIQEAGRRHDMAKRSALEAQRDRLEQLRSQFRQPTPQQQEICQELLAGIDEQLRHLGDLVVSLETDYAAHADDLVSLTRFRDRLVLAEQRFDAESPEQARIATLKTKCEGRLSELHADEDARIADLKARQARETGEAYLRGLAQDLEEASEDPLTVVRKARSVRSKEGPPLDAGQAERAEALKARYADLAVERLIAALQGSLPDSVQDCRRELDRLQGWEQAAEGAALLARVTTSFAERRAALQGQVQQLLQAKEHAERLEAMGRKAQGARSLKDCDDVLAEIDRFVSTNGVEEAEMNGLRERLVELRAQLLDALDDGEWQLDRTHSATACERILDDMKRKHHLYEGSVAEERFNKRMQAFQALKREFEQWAREVERRQPGAPERMDLRSVDGALESLETLEGELSQALRDPALHPALAKHLSNVRVELQSKSEAIHRRRHVLVQEWLRPFEAEIGTLTVEERRKLERHARVAPKHLTDDQRRIVVDALERLKECDDQDKMSAIEHDFLSLPPHERHSLLERLQACVNLANAEAIR